MLKVSSKEFQRKVGEFLERALKETITITHYGRDRLVLIDAAEYTELRKCSRFALNATELYETDIRQVENSEMSHEHNHLNSELKTD